MLPGRLCWLPKAALVCILAIPLGGLIDSGLPIGLLSVGYAETATGSAVGTGVGKSPAYVLGVQAYREGHYPQAAQMLKQALQRDPHFVNAHYYLGLVLDNLGQSPQAAVEYRFVVQNGHEARIVDFARTRLLSLTASSLASANFGASSAGMASNASSSGNPWNSFAGQGAATNSTLALMAAGNSNGPTVFRGSVSQIAVPLKNSKNALMVDASLKNGSHIAEGAFILDTGATYTSISEDLAEQLGLDLEHCEKVRITTANGRIDVPKVTLETLSVNGLEAHQVEATIIPVRNGSSFAGLLGLSFIRQFVLTIDPQAGQLVFRKN